MAASGVRLGVFAFLCVFFMQSAEAGCRGRRGSCGPQGGCQGGGCGFQGGGCKGGSCSPQGGGCRGGSCSPSGTSPFSSSRQDQFDPSGFESASGTFDPTIATAETALRASPASGGSLRAPALQTDNTVNRQVQWTSKFLRVDSAGNVKVRASDGTLRDLIIDAEGNAYVRDLSNGMLIQLKRGSGTDANGEVTLDNDERLLRDIGWLGINEKSDDPKFKKFLQRHFAKKESGPAGTAPGSSSGGSSDGGHGGGASGEGGSNRPTAERDESTLAPPDGASDTATPSAVNPQFEKLAKQFLEEPDLVLGANPDDAAKHDFWAGKCVTKQGESQGFFMQVKKSALAKPSFSVRRVDMLPGSRAEALALAQTPTTSVTDGGGKEPLTLTQRSGGSGQGDLIYFFKGGEGDSQMVAHIVPDGAADKQVLCTLSAVPEIARSKSTAEVKPGSTKAEKVEVEETPAQEIISASKTGEDELKQKLKDLMINADEGASGNIPSAVDSTSSKAEKIADAIRRTEFARDAYDKKWKEVEKELRAGKEDELADIVKLTREKVIAVYNEGIKKKEFAEIGGEVYPFCSTCTPEGSIAAEKAVDAVKARRSSPGSSGGAGSTANPPATKPRSAAVPPGTTVRPIHLSDGSRVTSVGNQRVPEGATGYFMGANGRPQFVFGDKVGPSQPAPRESAPSTPPRSAPSTNNNAPSAKPPVAEPQMASLAGPAELNSWEQACRKAGANCMYVSLQCGASGCTRIKRMIDPSGHPAGGRAYRVGNVFVFVDDRGIRRTSPSVISGTSSL